MPCEDVECLRSATQLCRDQLAAEIILMGAGHSIAVQNFNENLSILIMTGLYYLMIKANMSIYWVVTLFGLFVSSLMYLIRQRHLANQRDRDDVAHLDDSAH